MSFVEILKFGNVVGLLALAFFLFESSRDGFYGSRQPHPLKLLIDAWLFYAIAGLFAAWFLFLANLFVAAAKAIANLY